MRSGTAAAPNYAEARGAESRSDFIHKLRIVLKELNETTVWLQLIAENAMLPVERMRPLVAENDELCRILCRFYQDGRWLRSELTATSMA